MGDVQSAHDQAWAVHLRAAKLHSDAARFWESRGYRALAAGERERADNELTAALAESERCAPGPYVSDITQIKARPGHHKS